MSKAPRAYLYRYADPFSGKPVWRHTAGPWNGQKPAEALPLYERQQPSLPAALAVPEVAALVEALDAAIECGMVPKSSVKDGGACRHSRQVQVADMIRDAMRAVKEGGG